MKLPHHILLLTRYTYIAIGLSGLLEAQSVIPPVDFQTLSLPAATLGAPYSASLMGTRGKPPYRFTVQSGTLPPGLTLDLQNQGVEAFISGVPSQVGDFPVIFRITDYEGLSNTKSFTLRVQAQATFIITSSSLTPATLNEPYTGAITSTGGQLPFQYTLVGGNLPTGLALASSGAITGIPTVTGTFSFNVRAVDARGSIAQALVTLEVMGADKLEFSFPYLRAGKPGQYYQDVVALRGGQRPYRFFIVSGALPDGTRLGRDFENLGYIQGIPLREGLFRFRIRGEDATNRNVVEMDFTIPVTTKDFGIASPSLPRASLSQPYRFQIEGEGSNGPYTFSYFGKESQKPLIPSNPGLTLSQSGEIRGTPTQSGTWQITLTIADLFYNSAQKTFEFRVDTSSLRIETNTLPNGVVGQTYLASLRASGQSGAVQYLVRSGSLPEGLSVTSNGEIRGAPVRAGSYPFVVEAVDALGQTAQAALTLTINSQALQLSTLTLPPGILGQPYAETIAAAGGMPPNVYTLVGAPVPGLNLSNTGRLTGTPTQAGSFSVSIRAADSAGTSVTSTFDLRIQSPASPFRISNFAPPPGQLNFNFQFAFASEGGQSPIRWRLAEGTLPNGTRLDGDGLLRGFITAAGTYRFVVEAQDAGNAIAKLPVNIEVAAPTNLTPARVGEVYSARPAGLASGVIINSNAFGEMPEGLSLASDGAIRGIPQRPGLYTFGLSGLNDRGSIARVAVNLRVDDEGSGLKIDTPSLPGASLQSNYRQQLFASGGTGPYRWEVVGGRLPNGLSLQGETIAGTPLVEGFYSAVVSVTDSESRTTTRYYQMNVAGPISPQLAAVTNAASYEGRGVAPGEILTLFGTRLGSRVLFDGVSASLLYAGSGQVGVVAPFNLEGRDFTRIVVETEGVQSAPFRVAVLKAKPGIFSADGSGTEPGAILNQDGSANGEQRRARPQEIVVLYLTGGGPITPAGVDGQIATGLSRLNSEVEVGVGGQKAEVLYAGNAPGLIEGVIQMNVKIPARTASGLADLKVSIGSEATKASVGVWVREN